MAQPLLNEMTKCYVDYALTAGDICNGPASMAATTARTPVTGATAPANFSTRCSCLFSLTVQILASSDYPCA